MRYSGKPKVLCCPHVVALRSQSVNLSVAYLLKYDLDLGRQSDCQVWFCSISVPQMIFLNFLKRFIIEWLNLSITHSFCTAQGYIKVWLTWCIIYSLHTTLYTVAYSCKAFSTLFVNIQLTGYTERVILNSPNFGLTAPTRKTKETSWGSSLNHDSVHLFPFNYTKNHEADNLLHCGYGFHQGQWEMHLHKQYLQQK